MKSNPDPIDVHVGQRVRLRRMIVGLTQTELGNALNITFQQVQKYEQGANRIGSSRLFRISQILGVPVAFFFEEMPKEISKDLEQNIDQAETEINEVKMTSKETLNLIKNYYSINDDTMRRNVFNLVRSMNKNP